MKLPIVKSDLEQTLSPLYQQLLNLLPLIQIVVLKSSDPEVVGKSLHGGSGRVGSVFCLPEFNDKA